MGYETPILLLFWRRPDTLKKVLYEIKKIRPKKLFLSCDGYKETDFATKKRVGESKQLIDQVIVWPCKIYKNYSDTHKGCKKSVSQAISWFFQHVTEGIILEDDCLPGSDFFRFCSMMLKKYRHNKNVWAITGNNFQQGIVRGNSSYYFSKYVHIWGWATWRRCWAHYDSSIKFWPQWRHSSAYRSTFQNSDEFTYWTRFFEETYQGWINTWDYQWLATVWRNRGMTVTPQKNLVTNIGIGKSGTHTKKGVRFLQVKKEKNPHRIIHPPDFLVDRGADDFVFRNLFLKKNPFQKKKRMWKRIRESCALLLSFCKKRSRDMNHLKKGLKYE
jgi:hypothetical protein